jgi:hypothetical protein
MPLVKKALIGTTAGVRSRARPLLTGSFTILAAAPMRRKNRPLTVNEVKMIGNYLEIPTRE